MIEESHPLSGRTMAFETRYEVNIHVLSSWPAERLPAMCGSATLAMLVSSTSMNVARVTVRAMTQGLTAGRHAAASSIVIEAAPIIYRSIVYLATQLFIDPDLRHNRHSRAEFVSLGFVLVEYDFHGDALHHFDVVAGSIFWRQQAEARSAGPGNGIDVAFISFSRRIH